jgi:hypothetical protein
MMNNLIDGATGPTVPRPVVDLFFAAAKMSGPSLMLFFLPMSRVHRASRDS